MTNAARRRRAGARIDGAHDAKFIITFVTLATTIAGLIEIIAPILARVI